MATNHGYRSSFLGLLGSFAIAILCYAGTATVSTASAHDQGAFTLTIHAYDVAPLFDVAAIVAPAQRSIDMVRPVASPDDMTFAKINRKALAPSIGWEVALDYGAWRRPVS